jgi:hypothetical protein
MFLTSANISGKGEIYTVKEIKEEFWEYLKKWVLKFVGEELWDLKIPLTPFIKGECVKSEGSFLGVSEIFEFVGESLERKVVRG